MEHPSSDALARLIAELGLSEADRQRLSSDLERIRPGDGMRAGAFNDAVKFLEKNGPEHLSTFQRFRAQLPRTSAFSYLPLGYALLIYARVATLLYPEQDLLEACDALGEDVVELTRTNVLTRPLFAACQGDLGTYLEAFGGSATLITNFGEVYVDKESPTRYRLHHEDWYEFYGDYMGVAGYTRGLFAAFEIEGGEVEMERWDAHTFDVVIAW